MKEAKLTVKEFAERIGRPYPTVALWLRQGRIPGAQQVQVGSWTVWEIPARALKNFTEPLRGRPKSEPDAAAKPKPEEAAAAKKKAARQKGAKSNGR